jgi:hypothetical protein
VSAQNQQPESDLDPGVVRLRQRLRALRGRYPGLAVTTELTHIHDEQVVVRAALTFSDGGSITAYAAEPTDAGLLDTAIELAEQRALARALDLLGVGDTSSLTRREPAQTDTSAPRREAPPIEDAPARPEPPRFPTQPADRPDEDSTPPVIEALRRGTIRRQPPAEPEPEPVADAPEPAQSEPFRPEPARAEPARPEPVRSESNRQEPVRPEPQVTPSAAADPEPDMADYNWTHFWRWARANDLSTKGQVEQRINRPIDGLTPLEVRQLLHDAGIPL